MTFISVHSIQSKRVVLTDVLSIIREKILKAPTTSGHVTFRKKNCYLKLLKVTHLVISLQLQEKRTINHSSWHNGAEQRILEFQRLWNCHVDKLLFDLVLVDKKFMWSLGFRALSRLLRNRLVYWVQLECFLTNDGNVFGNVLSVGICQYFSFRGAQRPIVSKYVRSVSNSSLRALEENYLSVRTS